MGTCPSCGGPTEPAISSPGLAQASVERVREINARQRAITAAWNARWPTVRAQQQAIRADLARQVAAMPYGRRWWSWWRFTLLVR